MEEMVSGEWGAAMMGAVVVRIVSAADGTATPHDGRWVVAWDSDSEAGELVCTSTACRAKARRFTGQREVFAEWTAVSKKQPTRPWDGLPNRPLTGLSIEMEAEPH